MTGFILRHLENDVEAERKALQTANAAKTALGETLAEKETLLREVHHRVKNNLQIISSLLSMQAGLISDPDTTEAFRESIGRIHSIASVHELLYGSNSIPKVDIAEYLGKLIASLKATLPTSTEIHVEAESVLFPIDLAVPCGLLLNEIVTNATKHGMPESGMLQVHIALQGDENDLTLTVRDNGPGFPDGFEPLTGNTLGTRLILALSRQLKGKVDFANDGGAKGTFTRTLADAKVGKQHADTPAA